ncbi:MAG: sigma-70 family RNA polymerase sigma factor [Gemmatimonadetes bacterium]|uniref:Sigma-70 family RNA polymerase sigma factor n=1 Tax=Candidatus Kutchimonas denitrificans TaxID=3056748 RepID=A0AAE4Z7X3_9BACT|nr:sigma-70 family RNA polymerase sigma factor [Gemmatimonadota bacterium]NIR74884.1 sigma-70 family RNA polymerase sigma factor [Candidatus Kutchimonas denitrificans]NIR99995.1 sigma-70 family RNA polymerase sigma factor [Gemmatimonadota bacterium]NIT65579.1 sigma-70 family RNA polymerase sigma factor [Gemmatimonadota bacterium]NIU52549.1 sigma-70 family RNA polymerase sigma factor [Gemmatimonadota bacterium]
MDTALEADRAGEERELVARAREGDRTAFGTLVTIYMRRAYYVALGLVGAHDDALDLSQDAFARAYRAHASLDPERPFYPWLYQIVRRLCFNHLRDRRTRRRRMEEATPWLADEARATARDPAREAERAELRARLETAIDELSEREREVLVLREFQGLRYKEIAELLSIPIGTVMSRLYSARRNLAEQLEDVL